MPILATLPARIVCLLLIGAAPVLGAAETASTPLGPESPKNARQGKPDLATTHDPGLYLFVDDHWIAEQTGLKRIVNRARPLPRPILWPDDPKTEADCAWGNVIREPDGRFRLWYATMMMGQNGLGPHEMAGAGVWGRGDDFGHHPRSPADGREVESMLGRYAESEDGVHWIKPKLDRVTFRGRRDHNIVLSGELASRQTGGLLTNFDGYTILRDDLEPDPSRRYKMVAHWESVHCWDNHAISGSLGRTKARIDAYWSARGEYLTCSPDGLRWDQPLERINLPSGGGDRLLVVPDHRHSRWTAYVRAGGGAYPSFSYSPDLKDWSPPEPARQITPGSVKAPAVECMIPFNYAIAMSAGDVAPFTWKAGVAKVVVTPEKSVWLAGYGSKRAPDGKLHDLWAKALAIEDASGHRAVLITSDFQGVPRSMSDRVFERLRGKYGLERHQVMLTFSHNHCGPRLGDDLVDYYPVEADQVRLVDEYTDLMIDRLVSLVGQALSRLAPANLRTGQGTASFAVNRRNNREADVPGLLAKGKPLAGPVDHSVPVMTVSAQDGSLQAILFGYACHPTTLNFTTWCGDYPGFAQLELERSHPGATALFVNTCGGDQNPLPRRSVELCRKYGHMLADGVEGALKQPLAPVSPSLRTAFESIELAYLKVVTRDELTAAAKDANAIRARWAARLLKKLDAGETFPPSSPYPVHAWRLGKEMLVIGLGAESVVDYALRFKREYGPGTWVCGYTDDMISYIPSRRVWEEGGYEGGSNLFEYGRPALRWAGDVEDRIAAAVQRLAKRVRG